MGKISLSGYKNLIENNPVAFATITKYEKPNIIAVASVKVVSNDEILITDNYMNQTIEDIQSNRNICLAIWDSNMNGCKLVGDAEHFSNGIWKRYVENMEENKGLPAKGAVLIKVSKIIEFK